MVIFINVILPVCIYQRQTFDGTFSVTFRSCGYQFSFSTYVKIVMKLPRAIKCNVNTIHMRFLVTTETSIAHYYNLYYCHHIYQHYMYFPCFSSCKCSKNISHKHIYKPIILCFFKCSWFGVCFLMLTFTT